jgi:DNA-binding LacI/PurR family transcriptional regulator
MDANVCREMTLRDVARAAGVSMATVSRSLNDSSLIPEKTRRRIRTIADQLGFEFNAHDLNKSGRTGRSGRAASSRWVAPARRQASSRRPSQAARELAQAARRIVLSPKLVVRDTTRV